MGNLGGVKNLRLSLFLVRKKVPRLSYPPSIASGVPCGSACSAVLLDFRLAAAWIGAAIGRDDARLRLGRVSRLHGWFDAIYGYLGFSGRA